jgi:hypothetical protein
MKLNFFIGLTTDPIEPGEEKIDKKRYCGLLKGSTCSLHMGSIFSPLGILG